MTLRTGAQLNTREAIAELSTAQKSAKGAPAYSRYVNRRLGRYLAAAAYTARMTPNQVTAVSAVCTFSAIGLLVALRPSLASSAAVCLLLVLGYALDSADGQLARLTGTGSMAGEWLDHTVDAFKVGSIHLAVLVCWWRFYELDAVWLLVPLLFQVLATVHFFSTLLMDQLRRSRRADRGTLMAGDGSSSFLYSVAVLPTDFGVICLVTLLLWAPWAFTGAYVLLFVATAGFLVLALGKWYREVKTWS